VPFTLSVGFLHQPGMRNARGNIAARAGFTLMATTSSKG